MTGSDTPEGLLMEAAADREVEAWKVRAATMRAAAESFGGRLPTLDDAADWQRILDRYKAMEAVVFYGSGLGQQAQARQAHPAEERA